MKPRAILSKLSAKQRLPQHSGRNTRDHDSITNASASRETLDERWCPVFMKLPDSAPRLGVASPGQRTGTLRRPRAHNAATATSLLMSVSGQHVSGDGFGNSHDNGTTPFGEDVRERRGEKTLVGTIGRPNAQSLANRAAQYGLIIAVIPLAGDAHR